ncbi:hypothetical protein PUNSTDRAFT_144115 [Punctularia strigosozonata HHB-11173 SS5]|uniref:uncharacterized protein n=1 Tax=Punctularia strigosozonata (strain HHB-11173) TaxID=741275 RepID=UPI0004417190|nr:uncharacterized protein PUNSTDRAFT_144115 [Punctularia strigosozonata HHB-11173 SS5]EIN08591.1 hypothetical protein PUNSTDRAFT_144115 [Punctularia strigosozonata HHB-11173 SS5]
MKFLAAISLLAAVAITGTQAQSLNPPAPTDTAKRAAVDLGPRGVSLNPPKSALRPLPPRLPLPHTNAERLARGLPLKKPRRASRTSRASRVQTAKRQTTSATPVRYHGALRVIDLDNDGSSLGYVSSTTNDFGEYSVVDDIDDALDVTFTTADPTTPFDLSIDGTYPFLGATVSYNSDDNDLSTGSANFAYLTGVEEVAPGSPAVDVANSFSDASGDEESSESAIWTYDTDSALLAAQWINTNDAEIQVDQPPTVLAYSTDEDAIVLTGDLDSFISTYGVAFQIAFQFIPIDDTTTPSSSPLTDADSSVLGVHIVV